MPITATFPQNDRRLIRNPINPMDKSTIVSIYPIDVDETKPTLSPGKWFIPKGSYDKPSVSVVGSSSWFSDMDEKAPIIEVPISSYQIAESIVRDYCNGILECNMGDRMPGLFFLPGEVSALEVKTKHKARLDYANTNQRNWFSQLVKVADALWARTHGNPLAVSDIMRIAAYELGIEDRAWIKGFQAVSMIKCAACGALRNPEFPVCGSCKAIVDPVKAKELKLEFA